VFKWLNKAKKIFSGSGSDRSLVHIEDDGFMSDDISVSIEDIISDEENEDIGKLHVLSLTEFHEAMGDTWDAREDKIFLLTEAVLRDMIGKGNRWEHKSKEIYIMIFPALSEMDADARAYDIAEELGRKIIGERFDGSRRPFVRVAGVDPKDALSEDGTLNIEALEQAGRSGQSAGSEEELKANKGTINLANGNGSELEQKTTASQDENGTWHKNQHTSEEHDTDWHKQNHAHAETDTNWKDRHQASEMMSRDPKWKEQHQKDELKDDDGPQWVSMSTKEPVQDIKPAPAKTKSKYAMSYAPCWDRATESLHIYKALLNYNGKNGQTLEGHAAYAGHKTVEQRFKIDYWVMQNTAKTLFPLASRKIETPVFIPVHSSSLRGTLCEMFFKNLINFTNDLRQSYFIIEILDDGQWKDNDLKDVIERLKILVHGIAFNTCAENNFQTPNIQGIGWIGIDLSSLNEASGISPERLNALQAEVKSLGAKTYIFGLKRRAQIKDMLELGAELISGVALVKSTDKLRPPFNLPIARLTK